MRWMLNDRNWKLMGHWPYTALRGSSMETGGELMGVTKWVEARVPGSVHDDLLRAGLIADPFYGTNSLLNEWVENRWWQYRCEFGVPEGLRMERVTLEFKGVDYAGHFFFNGQKLGWHEGMYDPVVFDVAALMKDENRLDVVLENIPAENSQIGYTSDTVTQKARFGYKWDFCTRMVHLGLWDDVFLRCTGPYRLEDVFVRSDLDGETGVVRISGRVDGLGGRHDGLVSVKLDGHGMILVKELRPDPRSGRFEAELRVENPLLWQVNGLGEQPLYDLRIEVSDRCGASDEWSGRVGIRSLRYCRPEGASADALPYVIVVNGKKVYLKGVNMTPLSHNYGAVRREDYRRILAQAKNMGVNLIRVWGGGIIEKECFYELCDELGILVWQEFIQSSSGLDNIPSKKPEFLRLLEIAARAALKGRRSYTCHAVWSGGNELMNAEGRPANYGDENLAMLAKLCREYDPEKLFLPTSASGPNSWLDFDTPGRNHDIHGSWLYEGIRGHYDRYNRSDCMLHSEFGAPGMTSPEALCEILPPEHQRPTDMVEDLVWRHHGEWWDTFRQDTELFGELKDLKSWSALSQFLQGEAIRYILQANRRRKYWNCGSFIWQLNEPWPNVNCTCLLEHRGAAKLAAAFVKRAFAPVALSARYDTPILPAGEKMDVRIFLHNSLGDAEYDVSAEVLDLRGRKLAGKALRVCAAENSCAEVFSLTDVIGEVELGLVLVVLCLKDAAGSEVFSDTLIFTQAEEVPYGAMQQLPQADIFAKPDGGEIVIENCGDAAAMFVNVISADRKRPVVVADNARVLMPGEAYRTAVAAADGGVLPELCVRGMNFGELRL